VTAAVEQLAALLRQSGDLTLPTLTDAELAALSPLKPPYAHVVPLGTLLEVDTDEWLERARAGEASLLERGLLVVGDDGLVAIDELRAVLLAREQPLTVTIVEASVGGDTTWTGAFYGSSTDDFRMEEHTEGADHRFRLCNPDAAALDLAATLDPERRATRTKDNDSASSDEIIGAAERRAQLLSVRRTGPDSIEQHEAQIVVSEHGVWLVAGVVDARTGVSKLGIRPLNPASLVEALQQWIVAAAARSA
jgi:hypothetical protein